MAKKSKAFYGEQFKNTDAPQPSQEQAPKEKPAETKVAKPVVEEPLNPIVEKAMKLNPHMKSMWITSRGFVHQASAPDYLRKDAKFYVNKYYKQ